MFTNGDYFGATHLFLSLSLFIPLFLSLSLSLTVQSSAGFGLFVPRGFLITHNDAPQSVGLLWTSDQFVAETSTWQHITHTTDKFPYLLWDSNPRSHWRAVVHLRLNRAASGTG
jgi:hypothetical protein